MALTNPGRPFRSEAGFLKFEDVVYPELEEAKSVWQAAVQAWHNAVDGHEALGIPRNQALAAIHDDVKRRTNNATLFPDEPRTPFWHAQSTVIGAAGFNSDPPLVPCLRCPNTRLTSIPSNNLSPFSNDGASSLLNPSNKS